MAIDRHGGNLRRLGILAGLPLEKIIDFSASINPLGPPDWLRPLISSKIASIVHYPDPDCLSLVGSISNCYGVTADEVIVANGSTELLYLLPRAFRSTRAVIPVPAYTDYALSTELCGLTVEKVMMKEEDGFVLDIVLLESCLQEGDLVYIGRPNNPTGLSCGAEVLRRLATDNPEAFFIIDEAFADFVEGIDRLTRNRPSNVAVLCSFTKIFGIPGMRLGCMVADADVVGRVKKLIPPWSVNTFAQAVGEEALKDEEYKRRTREFVKVQRERLMHELQAISGLAVYPGEANFLLVRIDRNGIDAPAIAQKLLTAGIAIRVCNNFDGLDARFFRIAVRTDEENGELLRSLRVILGSGQRSVPKKKTPAVMFQGTGSNAGKSILTAAFCRILLQDGYRVAPFKAQNMSLNSSVTRSGEEMGRAQVVQAQASRLEPDVRMNPILLKPNSDTGSQVIVMGSPVGNMDVETYIRFKPEAFKSAKKAFDSLAEEYDVMVLEGAGSPGEVNLKHHDIVNMQMARYARSPVILVGDIDRGGVFASFVGTMEVLNEWERRLVAGFVVNRFRGRKDLLREALIYTEHHTGRPTFGVVPYLQDLGLPEEDSVTFKGSMPADCPPAGESVEIAVIDLPHISNFTDFDPFKIEPDVYVKIVRSPSDLIQPDALILPGSKNVIKDLEYLRKTGLAQKIVDLAEAGTTEIVGICGGFQFLGGSISDPYAIESGGETVNGLNLIPVDTTMASEKTLKAVVGKHIDSGLSVKGYEIHHGKTEGENLAACVVRDDGEVIGVKSSEGLLWGTYLHGIFDADEFRRWLVDRLRIRRGIAPKGYVCASYNLEPALDRLADAVRKSVQIDEIYKVMGLR